MKGKLLEKFLVLPATVKCCLIICIPRPKNPTFDANRLETLPTAITTSVFRLQCRRYLHLCKWSPVFASVNYSTISPINNYHPKSFPLGRRGGLQVLMFIVATFLRVRLWRRQRNNNCCFT